MPASPAEDPSSVLKDDPLLKQVPEVEGYKVLEPCVLYAKVGEGGMGAVYRGRHLNLDIDVAVKCLKNVLSEQSPTFVTRFQREARIAASVHHQNLVQVYDISHKNGVHYLVMEFVKGETARERVTRKKRLSETEACKVLLGAAAGLAEAHGQRIVHRDIKPDNILISFDGKVKVSDLGLAKALEVDAGPSLTMGVMGTPQYMAPEQWDEGGKVGPSADVWALGATFYYLLTGEHAIAGGSMQQIYKRICVDPFPDIRQRLPTVSNEVKAILDRCVQREVKGRYADCRELLRDLNRLVLKEEPDASLKDPASGSMRVPPLLSPPPPETLGHIKVAIQGEEGATIGVERKTPSEARMQERPVAGAGSAPTATPAPAPAALSPSGAPARQGLSWVLVSLGALVLIASGWWIAQRNPSAEARSLSGDSTKKDGQETVAVDPSLHDKEPPLEPTGPQVVETPFSSKAPKKVAPGQLPEPQPERPSEPVGPPPVPLLGFDGEEGVSYTRDATITIKGDAKNLSGVAVILVSQPPIETLAQAPLEISEDRFDTIVTLPSEGEYTFTLTARGATDQTRRVVYDPTPPNIDTQDQHSTKEHEIQLSVRVVDPLSGVRSVWAGASKELSLRPGNNDTWAATATLKDGTQQFEIYAENNAGGVTPPVPISIKADWKGPEISEPGVRPEKGVRLLPGSQEFKLAFSEPVSLVDIDGSSEPLDEDRMTVSFTRDVRAPQADNASENPAPFKLEWRAVDEIGNESTGSREWAVQLNPIVPEGWEADSTMGGDPDFGYRARRARDTRTGIWFRLLPDLEMYVAETEVTQGQWAKYKRALARGTSGELPVTNVSPKEVKSYCDEFGYRLPTDSEWRRFALAGSSGPYSFGTDPKLLDKYASYKANAHGDIQAVGSVEGAGRLPNEWGLFDVHGNVGELCWNESRGMHEIRGGSVLSDARQCTVDSVLDAKVSPYSGFRPVRPQGR